MPSNLLPMLPYAEMIPNARIEGTAGSIVWTSDHGRVAIAGNAPFLLKRQIFDTSYRYFELGERRKPEARRLAV